jgi:hypothetical protein
MTQIPVDNGKVVLRDGKAGTGQECCCGGKPFCCVGFYAHQGWYADCPSKAFLVEQGYIPAEDSPCSAWSGSCSGEVIPGVPECFDAASCDECVERSSQVFGACEVTLFNPDTQEADRVWCNYISAYECQGIDAVAYGGDDTKFFPGQTCEDLNPLP